MWFILMGVLSYVTFLCFCVGILSFIRGNGFPSDRVNLCAKLKLSGSTCLAIHLEAPLTWKNDYYAGLLAALLLLLF